MKDKVIDRIRNKKDKDGVEVFFLLCADADKLSTLFTRSFNSMLRHFEAIEKLELEIKERQDKIKEAYSELAFSSKFHEETASLISKENSREHKQNQALTPPQSPAVNRTDYQKQQAKNDG